MSQETAVAFESTKGFDSVGTSLNWYCPPEGWISYDLPTATSGAEKEESKRGWWKVDGSKLLLVPPAKKDFWRKTYYQPLLVKDDGPFLYRIVPMNDLPVTIETSFTISGNTSQFDQGGILIRLDHEHWLKTGIEVVDGQARLSCVVTNCFSDWSTQLVPHAEIKIRVHILPQQGGSFVVEAAPLDSEEWAFIRIAHLNKNMKHDLLNDHESVQAAYRGGSPPDNSIMVGVFGACPVDQAGMVVTFHDLSIVQGSTFVHEGC
jgi:regulation of enolase protein 1 (concanavalin A-like superfamily)